MKLQFPSDLNTSIAPHMIGVILFAPMCAKFGNEGVVAQNPYMRYYGWFDGSLSQDVVVDLPGTRHLERSARHD